VALDHLPRGLDEGQQPGARVRVVAGRLIRRERRCLSFAIYSLLFSLLLGAVALAGLVALIASADGVGPSLVLLLTCAPAAIVTGRLARGCFGAGLIISADALVVRGPWRTRRFALSQVEGFEAGLQQAASAGNPTAGVVLRLRDHSVVAIWALAGEGFIWNYKRDIARWAPTADALNALLKELAGEHPTTIPAASVT
jgi:hypothetical protein